MTEAVKTREYLALPIELCYFDRKRFDELEATHPTKILSYRRFDNGMLRVLFSTVAEKEEESREHLLWIQIVEIDGEEYVKYRCDCKYFEYRQFRPAKRAFKMQKIEGDSTIVVPSATYQAFKKLFKLDKHCFIALQKLFNKTVQIIV
jgi:hypothetical protein